MRGEQHGGAALGMSGAAVWDVGTFGEGVGGKISGGVATLGGGLQATLGGELVLWRGSGVMGYATLKFSGVGLSAGTGR